MTLAELKAQNAEAVEELRAELLAEARTEMQAQNAEAVTNAARTACEEERRRVLSLAGIALGKSAADRLQGVVTSGVTQEQLMALKDILGPASMRNDGLERLKAAHNVASLSTTPVDDSPRDFAALAKAYRDEHGVTPAAAIRAVAALHPAEHAVWIQAQQKEKN